MARDRECTMPGGCLCGAVRFTAAPKDREVGACHCSMCRQVDGGAVLGDRLRRRDARSRTLSNLGVYRSSEWAERCFCKKCGTPLFYRLVGKELSLPCRPRPSTTASGYALHQPDLHRREAGLLRLRQQDHEEHDGRGSVRCLRATRRTGRRRVTTDGRERSATSPSTSGRSIRRRTACCAWCWSSTARSSSASIRISACCIAAPRS